MSNRRIFTLEAQKLLDCAKDQAEQTGYDEVTMLDILLAAVTLENGPAAKILVQVHVTLATLRAKIEAASEHRNTQVRSIPIGYSDAYENMLQSVQHCYAPQYGETGMINPECILLGIIVISDADDCGFLREMFSFGDLRAAIVGNQLEAINAQLSELQKAVGIDNPEGAIAEAVRRLEADAEHLPLVHELRILLGAVSDADALRQAIAQAKDAFVRSSALASGCSDVARVCSGY